MCKIFLLFLLIFPISSLPQQTFLAPLNDVNVGASDVIFSFGTLDHLFDKTSNWFQITLPGESILTPSEIPNHASSEEEQGTFIGNDFNEFAVPSGDLSSSPSEIIYDYVHPEKKLISYRSEVISDINQFASDPASVDPIVNTNNDRDDSINHEDTEEGVDTAMRGSYAFVGSDGLPYMIDWSADDEGFHPSAPHLSKSVIDEAKHVEPPLDLYLAESVGHADFAATKDHLSDESSFDEMFSISGYDLPAYGDEVAASQIMDDFSLHTWQD